MRRPISRPLALLATCLLVSGGALASCGSDQEATDVSAAGASPSAADPDAQDPDAQDPDAQDPDAQDPDAASSGAADQTVCAADATAVATPYSADFPEAWTFPPDSVVYNVEEREGTGVIVTAVSTADFDTILDYLNTSETGFTITGGETEENDAEANFTTDGYTGRWAIRKSATCDGETVIQAFASKA